MTTRSKQPLAGPSLAVLMRQTRILRATAHAVGLLMLSAVAFGLVWIEHQEDWTELSRRMPRPSTPNLELHPKGVEPLNAMAEDETVLWQAFQTWYGLQQPEQGSCSIQAGNGPATSNATWTLTCIGARRHGKVADALAPSAQMPVPDQTLLAPAKARIATQSPHSKGRPTAAQVPDATTEPKKPARGWVEWEQQRHLYDPRRGTWRPQ